MAWLTCGIVLKGSSFGYQDVSQHHDATGASFYFFLDVYGEPSRFPQAPSGK
jgi:hypothetical protein